MKQWPQIALCLVVLDNLFDRNLIREADGSVILEELRKNSKATYLLRLLTYLSKLQYVLLTKRKDESIRDMIMKSW